MFAPISLDALVARAALQERADRKYLVDRDVWASLLDVLASDHLWLEIGGRRRFAYETIYFDTPALDCYRDHMQGRRRRFKCRTRLYADSGHCVFEAKLKDGRGRTLKRTLPVSPSEHGRLTFRAREFLRAQVHAAYGQVVPDNLVPVLRTSFKRVTLVAHDRPERLTCDAGLAFAARDVELELSPRTVLLETKTERGSGAADRWLRSLGARPLEGCSKYCLGIALTRGDVRNRRPAQLVRRRPTPLVRRPLPTTTREVLGDESKQTSCSRTGGPLAPERCGE
jgi:hypothetical protein